MGFGVVHGARWYSVVTCMRIYHPVRRTPIARVRPLTRSIDHSLIYAGSAAFGRDMRDAGSLDGPSYTRTRTGGEIQGLEINNGGRM